MGDTIAGKVATLRRQLGLPDGKTMFETVDEAVQQLGLGSEVAGLNLAAKVDACIQVLGLPSGGAIEPVPAAPPVVMGHMVEESTPMGMPVTSRAQVVPIVPVPAVETAPPAHQNNPRILSAHELRGCYLAFGFCLCLPVIGAIQCHTPKTEDHYHSCSFVGLVPMISTHWKRSHDNVWYAYEGGPDDEPRNRIGCGVQRLVHPDRSMAEEGLFNGCLVPGPC